MILLFSDHFPTSIAARLQVNHVSSTLANFGKGGVTTLCGWKMKKLIIFVLLLLAMGIVWLVFRARIKVDLAAMRHDPITLKLSSNDHPLIHSASLSNGLQTGVVALPDGEKVKFWFVSHHVAGPGCTRFDFSDGTRRYMMGSYFCCEVQIPVQDVKNRSDLIAFIEAHNES